MADKSPPSLDNGRFFIGLFFVCSSDLDEFEIIESTFDSTRITCSSSCSCVFSGPLSFLGKNRKFSGTFSAPSRVGLKQSRSSFV